MTEDSTRLVDVIHGPNLNLLGVREPQRYGTETLPALDARLCARGAAWGLTVRCRQTNHEGELVTWVQEARGAVAGIVLNPAAYTHTSVALRDALLAVGVPFIEVHLTNPAAREPFRRKNLVADLARGRIVGFGTLGYLLAIDAFAAILGAQAPGIAPAAPVVGGLGV